MQRVAFVGCFRMHGTHIDSIDDLQSRGIECREQLRSSPQAKMLGEIRQDQPALAAWRKVCAQPVEESTQHAAFKIVDSMLDGRAWPRGNPRRIAHHQWGTVSYTHLTL